MLNSELFLAREEEGIEFSVMKRSMLGFQKECNSAASEQNGEVEDEGKEEVRNSAVRTEQKNKEDTDTAVSEKSGKTRKPSLGEFEVMVSEDDEGFRTPTSQDHRMPVVKECPPAPRKPKPPSRKRKASPNAERRLQLLDLTEEVESLFPKPDFHDTDYDDEDAAKCKDKVAKDDTLKYKRLEKLGDEDNYNNAGGATEALEKWYQGGG